MMPGLRLNLGGRIFLWFFLNLLLLAVIMAVVLGWQFRFGIDFLFKGRAGERIDGLTQVISDELQVTPKQGWGEVLDRHSRAYGVKFLLFDRGGRQLAGEATVLPRMVQSRMNEKAPRFERAERTGRRAPEERGLRAPRPPEPPEAPAGPPPVRGPRFALRAGDPARYWVGAPMELRAEEFARPTPALLLIVSETLGGGGLFFDARPLLVVGGFALLLSVLFWLPMVRGITRALKTTTEATGKIADGRFDVRVDLQRSDEVGQLGQAVNQMASRLEAHVTGQKRFLGDIAHELCAPIARMQMALGILEQRADERQKPYVEDVREELQHMSLLVNELLSFSKASIGAGSVDLKPVALEEVVAEVVRREAPEGLAISVDVPAGLTAMGDAQMLSRAFSNILRNAIRYAGEAGPIAIAAQTQGAGVRIAITDSGAGVPVDQLENIFEPFFRLDTARTRGTGGAGLGLAIVRACVQNCGGRVSARNLEPKGFEVTVLLAAVAK